MYMIIICFTCLKQTHHCIIAVLQESTINVNKVEVFVGHCVQPAMAATLKGDNPANFVHYLTRMQVYDSPNQRMLQILIKLFHQP